MQTPTDFKNLKELVNYFSDEKVARQHLEEQRWGGNTTCPHCGTAKPYALSDEKTYKCANKECRKKFTVTVGTIFENTKLPLSTWFAAIYLCTAHKKGISSCQLARDLGITQKAAWFVLHRVREMLTEKAPFMLENEVEVDETFVGGKEKNKHASKKIKNLTGTAPRGRSLAGKTPVLGILERDGKVYAVPVKDTSAKTIQPIMVDVVRPGSTLYTDEWQGYKGLSVKYDHRVVQHGKGEYVVGVVHTNGIEGFWAGLKRGIVGIYHQVSAKHLHRYCNEFSYRYNTRKDIDTERFNVSLTRLEGRLTYKALIAKVETQKQM